MATVKRGFEINSDPNYCSLVLVNRGVTVSEDGNSTEVDVQLYGPASQLSCVLNEGNTFTCKQDKLLYPHILSHPTFTGLSPIRLNGLVAGRHKLKITPLGCSGGSKTLSVQFTT